MSAQPTLARRLALLVSAGLAAVWLVAVAAMALTLREEQAELYDQQLVVAAAALLPVLAANPELAGQDTAGRGDPDEVPVWRLIDRAGRVRAQSALAAAAAFPAAPRPGTLQRTATHMVHTTAYTPAGLALQFADPLAERREAWRESFLAFLLPMLALLPLGYLAGGWITRLALRPLEALRAEMAARDSRALAPMDPAAHPAELGAIVVALNGFMARLSQALAGERAFATNAAHELRTPVAVALAQVQRLARETAEPTAQARITAIEAALARMARLVTRLLQLARAEAGIGPGAALDAAALLPHVLRDLGPGAARVALALPGGPVWTAMDADALAILAGNLIENALQHGPADGPVTVALDGAGRLTVRNSGPALSPTRLRAAGERFARRDGGGFGLGLHIAAQIAEQAGSRLDLASPIPGRAEGFQAEITLPPVRP
ncbi:MAG: HAMP domain-containing sensor histidine kinase [Paracoccus aminovorans]|nr:HAMP domain-containing sensor histidine kinase [Paracoccus aminovorans]